MFIFAQLNQQTKKANAQILQYNSSFKQVCNGNAK